VSPIAVTGAQRESFSLVFKIGAKPLPPQAVQQIIDQTLVWVLVDPKPLRIVLFGSAAQGTMTDASDIDVLLIFDTEESLKSARRAIWESRPAEAWPVDLLFYTAETFRAAVGKGGGPAWIADREGRIVFERDAR
jgi:predicted nucleotidyltransferase